MQKKINDIEWSSEDATRTDLNFLSKCISTAIHGATTINIADIVGYTTPSSLITLLREFIRE